MQASRVGDTTAAGVLDELDVLVQRALRDLERGRLPRCAAFLELLWRHMQLDRVLDGIDRDDIAVVDKRDRAADLGLRHDVADAEPVRTGIGIGKKKSRGEKHARSVIVKGFGGSDE